MRRPAILLLTLALAACGGALRGPGAIDLGAPEPVHGDDSAIAWPFVVTNESDAAIVADFHLRLEEGGTLVGVRPDDDNPDAEATARWRGELRGGEGYWIGDALPKGGQVRLWALVRPDPGGDPRLRVIHWPTDGRDRAVGGETCQIWRYDTGGSSVKQEPC